MQISLVALAAIIVIIGAISTASVKTNPSESEIQDQNTQQVSDNTFESSSSGDIGAVLSDEDTATPTASPTPRPKDDQPLAETPTPKPTQTASPKNALSDYFYPGATVINASESEASLQSTEDAKTITDWYKSKLSTSGFVAKSFVTTNTNGQVENKLVAANSSTKISVTITAAPGSTVKIDLVLTE